MIRFPRSPLARRGAVLLALAVLALLAPAAVARPAKRACSRGHATSRHHRPGRCHRHTPVRAPARVTARSGPGTIILAWSPGANKRGHIKTYRVYRKTPAGWTRVAQVHRTSTALSGLDNGTTYVHRVTALDAAWRESKPSPQVSATPVAASASQSSQSWTCGWGTFNIANLPSACWRPYADSSFFNTPLPASPRLLNGSAADSRAMVSKILSMGKIQPLQPNPGSGDDYSHPYFFSSPDDPVYTVHCNKHDWKCPIEGAQLHIPVQARPAEGSDAHMAVIDQASGLEYDFWNVQSVPLPAGGGTITVGWGGRTAINGPGGGDAANESPADMSDTGLVGGIIRFQELAAGDIEHALFMVVGCSNGKMVYPGRDYGGTCSDPSNAPASGQWLRLDMSDDEIAALPVADWQKTILRALAKYGALVGDTGGNEAFDFQTESPQTYTSVGLPNPYPTWAQGEMAKPNSHISTYNDSGQTRYVLDVGAGVDWASHLEVVDPCVIQGAC